MQISPHLIVFRLLTDCECSSWECRNIASSSIVRPSNERYAADSCIFPSRSAFFLERRCRFPSLQGKHSPGKLLSWAQVSFAIFSRATLSPSDCGSPALCTSVEHKRGH